MRLPKTPFLDVPVLSLARAVWTGHEAGGHALLWPPLCPLPFMDFSLALRKVRGEMHCGCAADLGWKAREGVMSRRSGRAVGLSW